MGVAVQAVNNDPALAMYRTCQRYILLRFAAQAARLRSQNNVTLADALDEQADALMKRLREIPQDLGSSRPVSVTSANMFHSNADYPGDIYRASIQSGSRLAINAQVDKM